MIDAPGYRRFLELPEAERALLRDRARETAAKGATEQRAELLGILELECGGQHFALPLEAVEGVMELQALAPVPRAPALVRGLVTFRGEVLLAADLSRLYAGSAGLADLRRVVAVAAGGKRLALLTHKGLSVRLADRGGFKPAETSSPSAVLGVDCGHVALLDPAALIAQIFSAVEARRG